jgi:hypothetical protein
MKMFCFSSKRRFSTLERYEPQRNGVRWRAFTALRLGVSTYGGALTNFPL